ncbi:hypothetical protein RN001_002119 [Aquatica leii]|uniref:Uncharacterized protein n=1 Tax=Aquatica leii TaxID=1421715 RepID=A0AAN7PGW9_9COLE|nr:hypothetical protein RN001_002119 [Aquatica leii]
MAISIIIFSTLLLLFVEAHPDEFNNFEKYEAECYKEIHVGKELVEALLHNDVFNEDKNLKCFLSCLYIKSKVMNADGQVNIEELKKILLPLAHDKNKMTTLIEKCAKIKEADNCETSFKITKCLKTD